MKKLLPVAFALLISLGLSAQDFTLQTFRDTRVINTHSIETLPKRKLDVRIAHRFGDFAGDNGGFQTLFGLENASDVLIGAEYGFTDDLTIGLYRTKGAGSMPNGTAGLRQLLNGVLKYRFMRQTEDGGTPVSMALVGNVSMSTAEKVENSPEAIRSFPKFSHRFAYNAQMIIARKFSHNFSLQVIPGFTHRALVPFEDENSIFSLGAATRVQLSKVYALVADATFPLTSSRSTDAGFYPAVGIGLEIDTGGHVFQVNFTNATAIMETDYIPYTTSNWADGEFRLGFTISRWFNL